MYFQGPPTDIFVKNDNTAITKQLFQEAIHLSGYDHVEFEKYYKEHILLCHEFFNLNNDKRFTNSSEWKELLNSILEHRSPDEVEAGQDKNKFSDEDQIRRLESTVMDFLQKVKQGDKISMRRYLHAVLALTKLPKDSKLFTEKNFETFFHIRIQIDEKDKVANGLNEFKFQTIFARVLVVEIFAKHAPYIFDQEFFSEIIQHFDKLFSDHTKEKAEEIQNGISGVDARYTKSFVALFLERLLFVAPLREFLLLDDFQHFKNLRAIYDLTYFPIKVKYLFFERLAFGKFLDSDHREKTYEKKVDSFFSKYFGNHTLVKRHFYFWDHYNLSAKKKVSFSQRVDLFLEESLTPLALFESSEELTDVDYQINFESFFSILKDVFANYQFLFFERNKAPQGSRGNLIIFLNKLIGNKKWIEEYGIRKMGKEWKPGGVKDKKDVQAVKEALAFELFEILFSLENQSADSLEQNMYKIWAYDIINNAVPKGKKGSSKTTSFNASPLLSLFITWMKLPDKERPTSDVGLLADRRKVISNFKSRLKSELKQSRQEIDFEFPKNSTDLPIIIGKTKIIQMKPKQKTSAKQTKGALKRETQRQA